MDKEKKVIEYIATCPICGGYVMVYNAEAQDFACTCCKRVWVDGKIKDRGVYNNE